MGSVWSKLPILLIVRIVWSSIKDEEICIRGVEMAGPVNDDLEEELKLTQLTRCSVVSLLRTSNGRRASLPLDEAAISAVLKAETLLVREDLDFAEELGLAYGKLLRGSAHLIVPSKARLPNFEYLDSSTCGYSWYKRSSANIPLLELRIISPQDGELLQISGNEFEEETRGEISVSVALPSKELLDLLPSPRLLVAADSNSEFPLVIPLTKNEQLIEISLSDVPSGSHLLTASLAYGEQGRVVPDASASAMIDVVPINFSQSGETLGCARAGFYSGTREEAKFIFAPSTQKAKKKVVQAISLEQKLRVALADIVPGGDIDTSRRNWLQRASYWNDVFELSYLLLYDATTPAIPENAAIRQSLRQANIRAVAVAAPWHQSTRATNQVEAARACAANKDSAASTAWLEYLKARVDVLILNAAPSPDGPRVDAARLACLGALARKAGLNWIIQVPSTPQAELFAWGQNNKLLISYPEEKEQVELFANFEPTKKLPRDPTSADAIIVSSHYAASTLSRLLRGKKFTQGLADATTPIAVLQPGVDDEWFRAGKNTTKREKKTALWLGHLHPSESPLLFIRACALLASSGEDIECLVVGDGPLRAPLIARAKNIINDTQKDTKYNAHQLLNGSLSLGSTRFVREEHIHLPQLVASSHVLVSTSISTKSNYILEAAAAGVAVVAFATAGAEYICHGVNALVPEKITPTALASSIRRLLRDESTAHSLGRAGYIAAAAHFAAHKAADRAAHLVKSLFSFTHSSNSRPRLAPVYDHHSFFC
mmetsp:Transcript_13168/g.19711  ORF Transcript_13168/g.19711 Transcript_13168/m.19711 type:complete len:773 (+) Transcript_13168:45-2363(+)